MPDPDAGEILNLSSDFPPVPTAAWEAAIAKDLKGADYEKKLVWRTEEGLAIRPYYRQEALAGLGDQLRTSPDRFPFVRGTGRGWEIAQDAKPGPRAIRADWLHESGAHAVQELGYGIAAGVERLAELTETLPVDTIASQVEFVFAAGPSYFIEIAKLRAARVMWAQVVAAFGSQEDSACRMRLQVRTPRRNKSAYDCYTNLLRATTEALSAVIGGCDRLTVEPFGFDPHLAENVQHILQEEAHLDAVADPAGGSYYIEALTDLLAREGWKLLQQLEAAGGYSQAVESGAIEKALAETRGARAKAYSSRRRVLVGVNNYPNLMEKAPAGNPDGAMRIAEPFEAIRQRTNDHAAATGRYPKVLLLTRGDVKMRGARANFSLNFLGCAGFDIVEADEYRDTDADLIVLCSSDAEYLALAQEVCPQVKAPVIVAGNPKDQIAALQAAGVQGFIHVQSDAIETLRHWQDKLGMRSSQ
ncbi:MAG TPA: methylmalonyl-CoA mutase family protein [Bryobacteraceae bacterium]|jgi:methylmalonyl-CoA mutase|nr:methylmalonyl-CoA mutase family protein [Bryobacteraceae bacterium]